MANTVTAEVVIMLTATWLMLGTLLYSLQLNTGSFPRPLTEEEERRYTVAPDPAKRELLSALCLVYTGKPLFREGERLTERELYRCYYVSGDNCKQFLPYEWR